MLTLLLTSMLTLAFNVRPVKGDYVWTETIYVQADGSIQPPTAPISSVDNVTYTLTDSILGNVPEYSSAIIIQRNNIVVDGAGYTVQGIGRGIGRGISLYERSNVTIKKMEIKSFGDGIYLRDSSNTSISGNNIINNWCSIYLDSSSYNSIVGNNLTNNDDNIFLQSSQYTSISGNKITNNLAGIKVHYHSSYNSISNNHITNNWFVGISISYSSDNSISGNNITNNVYDGIDLWESSNNSIYHNNLINNTSQVITDSVNTWDKGYPSGGNYWSDYAGIDANSDGIGDTSYIIDADNQDRYPLMHPWSPLPVHNINTGLGYATIQEAINAPETLNEHTIFVEAGTYYEHVVVSKSISLMGEDESHTVIDGSGAGKVVLITANNVSMSGFAIRYSGYGLYDAGIWITSNSNSISNNHISNNSWGISLEYATLNTIKDNVIDGSWHSEGSWGGGVVLWSGSNNNLILHNVISCREDNGIYLQGNENQIIGNTIMNYYFSAVHFDSNGNILYHNNFMEKEISIIWIAGAHIWDNGYPSGGNYWSDYTGVDSDGDGIGDTPYVIDADNQDRYPLMYQWRGHSLCDVNGDGSVDMADISLMIDWFMTSPPNWNPNCDVNNDLTIDMADISLAIDHFMQS